MKLKLVVLLTSTFFTTCVLVKASGRIMGGHEAPPNSFPFMVKLFPTRYGTIYNCGGSLISLSRVLTSAHCIAPGFRSALVIAGVHRYNELEATQQRRTVGAGDGYFHPFYLPEDLDYDVGYIVVNPPFTETPYVRPISIALENQYPNLDGMSATVSGWGYRGPAEPEDDVLRYMSNTVISNEECQQFFGAVITENMVCMKTHGVDACEGDSGGPMWITQNGQNIQVGIVSFGPSCAPTETIPRVYARVDRFLDFIMI